MTITIAQLDTIPEAEAAFKLAACCGSSRWVAGMINRRPFGSREALLDASDHVARDLVARDWLEAFTHHPRIGELRAHSAVSPLAAGWSSKEQAAAAESSTALHDELALANVEYEKRFGFIFIICASGRSAAEMLAALRERLGNDPDAEIFIAAREQQQITRLRLEKLIAKEGS